MKSKLALGVMWLGAAKVVVNLLAALSTLVLAKFLTPADFGLVAIALTLLTIVGTVTELSLSHALIQQADLEDDHLHSAWTLNLLRALSVGVLFCASAPLVVHIYGDSRLLPIIVWLSASILLSGFSNPKMVVFTRRLEFWQEFVQTVAQKLAGFLVGVGVAYVYQSYWALIAGTLASQLAAIVVSYTVCPYRPRFSLRKARDLWGFSVWLSLGQLINILNWKLDHLLVGSRLGQDVLGHYSVGDNLAGMPTRELVGPIERTLFPGFANIGKDRERLSRAYTSAQTLVCSLALPAGVGLATIAHPMVLLAMGERWLPIVTVIEFVAVTVAFQTISSAAHPLAMAGGETKMLFRRDLISFCVRIPMIVVGLYWGGLLGLLCARAVSTVISICMNMYIVRTMIGLGFLVQLRNNLRAFVSVGVMAVALVWVKGLWVLGSGTIGLIWSVLALIGLGALVYAGVHGLLWRLAGKPAGPEAEVLRVLSRAGGKLRDRFART